LNFALSGKQVGNKEREAFLELYAPRWNDSTPTQKQKLSMIRNYFDKVMQMRNAGADDDAIAAEMRRAISTELPGQRSPRSMSDDELLRELNR
jgi:hypothetical protein